MRVDEAEADALHRAAITHASCVTVTIPDHAWPRVDHVNPAQDR
jgi:hypothetical protein